MSLDSRVISSPVGVCEVLVDAGPARSSVRGLSEGWPDPKTHRAGKSPFLCPHRGGRTQDTGYERPRIPFEIV